MRNLICIVCPVGCSLDVEADSISPSADNISVTGNKCPRGAVYAREEICAPKRVVTATCQVVDSAQNKDQAKSSCGTVIRVPVKSASPCPREKIPALLEDIYKTKVPLPVKTGDVVIANWKGEGIDVVATRCLGIESSA